MNRLNLYFLSILIGFVMLSCPLYAGNARLKNSEIITAKNGLAIGFRFDVQNVSHDGSYVSSIHMFLAIFKWEDGKKIYLGCELYVVDCHILQGDDDSFEFVFKGIYGKTENLGYDLKWSYVS